MLHKNLRKLTKQFEFIKHSNEKECNLELHRKWIPIIHLFPPPGKIDKDSIWDGENHASKPVFLSDQKRSFMASGHEVNNIWSTKINCTLQVLSCTEYVIGFGGLIADQTRFSTFNNIMCEPCITNKIPITRSTKVL